MTVRAFRSSITAAALLVAVAGGVTVAVASADSTPTQHHTAVVRVDGTNPAAAPTPTPTVSTDNTIWD
ncbi:hypothetical protein SAMN05216251_10692 [Actinacidiphila alni]|uniref:Uncharacterized protein n=1 Tax=Actinacidiphila alni TaxID=380248 RepID=A0A1I2E8V4_9ACTN|nr:hypothetical protein [Actinacidiphila alni]SFE89382.1 hypothetical protein SAMN05216251_10692 [Actinacidiphila alni]